MNNSELGALLMQLAEWVAGDLEQLGAIRHAQNNGTVHQYITQRIADFLRVNDLEVVKKAKP